jgi:hypothetical protein
LARRFIQPLSIVNHQQDWLVTCAFGQKCQGCKRNQPDIRCFGDCATHAKRIEQGSSLMSRQRLCLLHERAQCLLKSSERQMGFGENARHAEDDGAAFTRLLLGLLKQRRFANSGCPADKESGATLIDPVKQLIDESGFFLPSQQNWYAGARDRGALLLPGQRQFFQPFRHRWLCALPETIPVNSRAHPTIGQRRGHTASGSVAASGTIFGQFDNWRRAGQDRYQACHPFVLAPRARSASMVWAAKTPALAKARNTISIFMWPILAFEEAGFLRQSARHLPRRGQTPGPSA